MSDDDRRDDLDTFAALTDRRILDRLAIAVYELNLLSRIASGRGIEFTLDLAEIEDEGGWSWTKIVSQGVRLRSGTVPDSPRDPPDP